jgi:hypothetical protein
VPCSGPAWVFVRVGLGGQTWLFVRVGLGGQTWLFVRVGSGLEVIFWLECSSRRVCICGGGLGAFVRVVVRKRRNSLMIDDTAGLVLPSLPSLPPGVDQRSTRTRLLERIKPELRPSAAAGVPAAA